MAALRQGQVGDFQAGFAGSAGFGKDRVGLAVHLLQQEIEFFADFAAGVEHAAKLGGVDFEARQLFADIAAVGEDGCFLGQALRIDLHAFQQSRAIVQSRE